MFFFYIAKWKRNDWLRTLEVITNGNITLKWMLNIHWNPFKLINTHVSHSMQEVKNVGSIEITFTFIILIKSSSLFKTRDSKLLNILSALSDFFNCIVKNFYWFLKPLLWLLAGVYDNSLRPISLSALGGNVIKLIRTQTKSICIYIHTFRQYSLNSYN